MADEYRTSLFLFSDFELNVLNLMFSYIRFFLMFIFMYVSVLSTNHACKCSYVMQSLQRPKEGIGFPLNWSYGRLRCCVDARN